MKHDPSRSRFNSTHRARARSRAMAGSTYGTPDHAQLWARTDPLNLWNVRGRRRIDHRDAPDYGLRSEEHTSELQSLMRLSYAVFCLKKKNDKLSISAKNIHLILRIDAQI